MPEEFDVNARDIENAEWKKQWWIKKMKE